MPNWHEILTEINGEVQRSLASLNSAQDTVRRKYFGRLYEYTQPHRNIIAYYSGWLSKAGIEETQINDEDKNGFMTAVNKLDRSLGLDLILHTPGGELAATESIVDYLRKIFGTNIRAIIPQIAMSAGTMIACSCRSIVMGKQSNLGPVDPQFGQISAAGVIDEFKKAYEEIKTEPQKAQIWQFVIGRYAPSFLGQCENAVERAKQFVRDSLKRNMLSTLANKEEVAEAIVKALTDFSGNKGHDKHIHYDECVDMGLTIEPLEDSQEYQDLVLSLHHCYMNALMNTPAFKIIENHMGIAVIKNQPQAQLLQRPIGVKASS
jgi:hypothetical protein